VAELERVGWDTERGSLPTLYRPVGCAACGRTGFHGRFAVHEVMLVSEELGHLIAEGAHSNDLKKLAIAQGMLTLRQAGLHAAAAGTTSLDEILRVIA
jgi:type IV pilus assembly protein PilB